MVTKSDKGGTQYSDVTHSVLFFQIYTSVSPFSCFNGYHKFANDFALSGCFLSFGLLKYKGHDVTGNRPNPWVFTSKLFNGSECGTPLSIFAEHLSVFLLTTHQYICGRPVTIFGNTYQCFCRTRFSIFAGNLSTCFQNAFQYFCRNISQLSH